MESKTPNQAEIEFEDSHTEIWDWPLCQVEGCENRICLGVSNKFCHPHSGGKEANKLIKELNNPIKEKVNV